MITKLLAGLSAVAFVSLSTAAFAACPGHTAQTSTPVQTADISVPSDSSTQTEQRN